MTFGKRIHNNKVHTYFTIPLSSLDSQTATHGVLFQSEIARPSFLTAFTPSELRKTSVSPSTPTFWCAYILRFTAEKPLTRNAQIHQMLPLWYGYLKHLIIQIIAWNTKTAILFNTWRYVFIDFINF